MARVTAEEYAQDWAAGLSGSTARIRRGIERVTVSPGVAAAAAADRTLQAIIRAFQDGTWAAQLRKMTVEDWRASAIGKGLARIAQGVEAARPSQVEMATKLLAAVDATLAEVNKIPRGTLEQNIQRAVAMMSGMASRKLRRPGR